MQIGPVTLEGRPSIPPVYALLQLPCVLPLDRLDTWRCPENNVYGPQNCCSYPL